jgi:hypothetical protein
VRTVFRGLAAQGPSKVAFSLVCSQGSALFFLKIDFISTSNMIDEINDQNQETNVNFVANIIK